MTTLIAHMLPVLLGLLVKGTLLLFLAWIASLILSRASAATRHLIWVAAIGSVLLLPILSLSLPRWNVVWSHAAAPSAAAVPATALPVTPAPNGVGSINSQSPAPTPQQTTDSATANLPTASTPTFPMKPKATHFVSIGLISVGLICAVAGLTLWLIGTVIVLTQFFVGLYRVNRIRQKASSLEGVAFVIARDARKHLHLRPVSFLQANPGSAVGIPMTWGMIRPTVLLPAQSVTWSKECLQAALLHELAHVKRWDWLTQSVAHFVCALYWWHPLVWLAAKQAREESERACDDLVLSTGIKATDYAQRLVEVVRSMPNGVQSKTVAIAMAQPSEVEGRLRAVLALEKSRYPLTMKQKISGCAMVLMLILPLAALRLTPSAQAGMPIETSKVVTTADGHVAIVNGNRAVFPNGYEVSLVAVTQAVRTGDEWDMFGGPWWRPDGTPIAPQTGGLDGHWHWSVVHTNGLSPFVFKVAFRAPASTWEHGESRSPGFFAQFLGALKPNNQTYSVHFVSNGPHPTVRDINSPLVVADSTPHRFGGAVNGTRSAELYPSGTRACTVRCGVAAGPWQTVSRHPFPLTPASVITEAFVTSVLSSTAHDFTDVSLSLDDTPTETYLDARGKRHVFYFLGASGRLGNVARRFVAVDRAGRVIPLNEFGAQRIALSFSRNSDVTRWNPTLDLAKVKEFRLQTCPYLTVEFSNVQLQPVLAAGVGRDEAATLLTQASVQHLEQARQLRAHLKNWAESNRALVEKMAHANPGDLSTLMAVYDSLQRLPFPLWDDDPRLARGSEDAQFTIGLPSRLTLTHLQRSEELAETRMRRDFTEFHDLAVTQSQVVNAAHLTLWASGRITQTTARDQFLGHGNLLRTVGTQQEIVPAFFQDNSPSSVAPLSPPQLKLAIGFRRYTSPLLPDGSRYTFLYPSYYSTVNEGWLNSEYQFGTVRIDCIGTKPVPWIAAKGQTPVSYYIHGKQGGSWLAPHEEFCSVVVGRAGNVSFPVGSSSVRDDTQWVGENGSHHHVMITDRRSHYGFELIHEDRYTPALFKQTDPVIFGSFRILPPDHLMGRSLKRQ